MSTPLVEQHAATIKSLHEEARRLAGKAIDTAREAGRLLCEVKEQLPHGEFGPWVQTNCGFTQRTAQRYMDLHRNPDRLRGHAAEALVDKCDTVSLLEWIEPLATDWTTITLADGSLIDITPSAQHPGYLHVSMILPTEAFWTKRPVRPDYVEYIVSHVVDDAWMLGTREAGPCPHGFNGPIFREAA